MLGIRILRVNDRSIVHSLLLNEVQYQQECATNPIAILVMDELWPYVVDMANEIEYTIWRLPASSTVLFPKIAHILYELPWNKDVAHAIDVHSVNDVDLEMAFIEAARREQLCLVRDLERHQPNIRVALGKAMQSSATRVNDAVTIAVPLVSEDLTHINSLPEGSYIFVDQDELGNSSRVSTVLIVASALHSIARLIVQAHQNCSSTVERVADNCLHPTNWNLDDLNALPPDEAVLSDTVWPTQTREPNIDLVKIIKSPSHNVSSLKKIASINVLNNVTTIYHYRDETSDLAAKLGAYFQCANSTWTAEPAVNIYDSSEASGFSREMYWRIKPEIWVAIGLTLSVLGVLITFAIFIFILVRLYLEDVMEGNPVGTIALLISLIMLFTSFIPFAVEYTSDRHVIDKSVRVELPVVLCSVRVLFVTLCYCFTFSLILCRTLMLASIGSEGGFLSHVNGYIQSVICVFSTLVQVGMSTQLLIVMYVASDAISCDHIYYGSWFWVLLGYDMFLLGSIVLLTPFIARSQRNYREGILIIVGTVLCVAVWATWIPFATFDRDWRDAAVPLGVQATGWAVLAGILIPRSFLIVRGIARADLAQALPSLASLAFASNTQQYMSEQVRVFWIRSYPPGKCNCYNHSFI